MMSFKVKLIFLLLSPLMAWTQPNYTILTNTNPHPGNLFFHVGGPPSKPVNILEASGELIYSEDLGLKGWAWQVNLNNKITYFDRQSKGWFVMDSLKNVVDSVYCKNEYIADLHDFLALENGNYVLFSYDEQEYATDTISPNGSQDETVIGLVIQELDSAHNVIFEWKSWDHFYMSDYPGINYNNNTIDFLHCNAIDIDEDGHFLISNRTISEITKIHRTTGEIIWRFGGAQSDFTFLNDYPFSQQHCIKSLGNNKYLLYDNGNRSDTYTGGIKRSRGVEYELNLNDYTATKTWDYVHPDSLFTPSIGSIQRLDNGNTLINFGNNQSIGRGSVITEVDSNNIVVFEIELDTGERSYCANKAEWNFYTEPTVELGDLNEKTSEQISIYPNPSSASFQIELEQQDETFREIEIFNLNGEALVSMRFLEENAVHIVSINEKLRTGVYIVKATSNKYSYCSRICITN